MDTPSLSTSQARRLHPTSSIPGRNPGTQPCPLVTDEETEAQASGAAQSPQDRVGTEGQAISTPETVLLPFQETLRGEREAEVQGGWEMLPGRRVVGLVPQCPCPCSAVLGRGWPLAGLPGTASLGLASCFLAPPAPCFCTFSKLKTRCCPFLGKKS